MWWTNDLVAAVTRALLHRISGQAALVKVSPNDLVLKRRSSMIGLRVTFDRFRSITNFRYRIERAAVEQARDRPTGQVRAKSVPSPCPGPDDLCSLCSNSGATALLIVLWRRSPLDSPEDALGRWCGAMVEHWRPCPCLTDRHAIRRTICTSISRELLCGPSTTNCHLPPE